MRINAIGSANQTPRKASAITSSKEYGAKKPGGDAEISKLNAEIKQTEAEIKKTWKEVQKATEESIGGASDQAQMLQSKILMQQQEVMMKQMQVKEIEAPTMTTVEQASTAQDVRPQFDRYLAGKEESTALDNVYRLEEKDGARQIIFNRPEE